MHFYCVFEIATDVEI